MAQVQPALGLDRLTGVDARFAAIAKLEALSEEIDAALARRKSNGFIRRGIKAWHRGDFARAGQHALAATEADPQNSKAFHILAMALERMGHLHKALVTYERAFELDPDDSELLINLGLIAWRLKISDGAMRMFQLYIGTNPDSPLGYNNLGSVLSDLGDYHNAIETLRAAIYRMPRESILWNSLATVLAETGRAEESLIFYREAIDIDPKFARLHHNLGYAYSHLGQLDKALEAYDFALAHATDPVERMEAKHSRSICLMGMGQLKEGFREYEIRNDERFRAYAHHMIKAPMWKGEDLNGKRLLVVGEQGLGDEFMFANILPDLARAVGENGMLEVAVDPRLIPLFQRSFPKANIGTYEDRTLLDKDGNKSLRFLPFSTDKGEPDCWTPMGSALQFLRHDLKDFRKEAFLVPDAARKAQYSETLKSFGPGPYVGICWRSMMMTAKRAKYYSALDMWEPLFRLPGVTFVNVQYGDCAEELAQAEARFGIKIHAVDGLDLKDDIDGGAALSAALDLVIAAPTAAAAVAGAVGTEVWFLTAGRTWPQLGTEEFPWYAKTRVFTPEKFADWTALMQTVANALKARVCS
jgi:tetratricopeptide (TPR) repeat protein